MMVMSGRALATQTRDSSPAFFAHGRRDTIATSPEARSMDARSSRYPDVYARWQRDPEGFWGEAAKDVDSIEPPKKIFDKSQGLYGRWFSGFVFTSCSIAL